MDLFNIAVLVAIVGSLAVVFVLILRQWWRQHASASWPWAKITIESSDIRVAMRTRSGRPTYELTLGYSYSVDGKTYSGAYRSMFSAEREATEFLKSLQELPPPARYRRGNPAISVLDPFRDAALALRQP